MLLCFMRFGALEHAGGLPFILPQALALACLVDLPHPPPPFWRSLQATTVGIPEPVYRPGVRLGEIKAATVAAEAGLRQGDVLMRVGDLEVAPAPSSVQDVVAQIRWVLSSTTC